MGAHAHPRVAPGATGDRALKGARSVSTGDVEHAKASRPPILFGHCRVGKASAFKAVRMLISWFQIMLDEAGGAVDVAIRAYKKGIGPALLGES